MSLSLLSPAALSLICEFLSSPQEILICLSRLSRSISRALEPACFQSQGLSIASPTELLTFLQFNPRPDSPSPTFSSPSCLARVGAVHSLAIVCDPNADVKIQPYDSAFRRFFELKATSSPSPSFLFSSLTSLSICCHPYPSLRVARRSLFRLLESQSTSFASLTSLDVDVEDDGPYRGEVHLEGLRELRQVRLGGSLCPVSCLGSALRAMWSLPRLQSLDLSALSCSDEGSKSARHVDVVKVFVSNPPPPSSVLRHLFLPIFPILTSNITRLRSKANRLARALTHSRRASDDRGAFPSFDSSESSLGAAASSTLTLSGLETLTSHLPFSVPGLALLLSLPSLRVLDLTRARIEMSHLCQVMEALSTFRGPQPSLIALLFPILEFVEFDGDVDELMDRFGVLLPPFLSRHAQLRHLSLPLVMEGDGVDVQTSMQPLQQLQSL